MDRNRSSPLMDRLLTWSSDHPLSLPMRYLVATLLVGAMALVRVLLITSLVPWLLFIPVVLMIALTMGRQTGFYAVLLSATLAMLSVDHPGAVFWLTGAQWAASAMFILVSGMIVVVGAELRAGFLRARRKEEQDRLLNNELGHRLKNLLGIVQAVASQTLRQSPDLATASDALSFRLAAFGRAADVLTASSWESAELHALARAAVAGHAGYADRLRLDGPPLRFNSQVALSMALAFHELATNATKYGALSNDTGHVELRWSVTPGETPDKPQFNLTWREIGGPRVEPPSRRGFGSLLIERSLRSYFRGVTSISYEPSGLVFTIDAPLAGAQA